MTIPAGKLYDIIIIGGSYAGLSAALTLYRATHSCLILDDQNPRNAAARATRLTPGWEGQQPENLRKATRAELIASGLVDFLTVTATSAKKCSDGVFEVTNVDKGCWRGKKILLATGVQEVYPQIEGYKENYGKTIYFCMFCYGYEHKDSRLAGVLATGILSNPVHAMINARDARKFAETVIIFTNGNKDLAENLQSQVDRGIKVDDQSIEAFHTSAEDSVTIRFRSGKETLLTFVVHKPDLQLQTDLLDSLEVDYDQGHGIKVKPPFNQTSVSGVYAAGDCCSPLRMIPNAMSMGAFAGCGLARELPKDDAISTFDASDHVASSMLET